MKKFLLRLALVALLVSASLLFSYQSNQSGYDECDAHFIAYIGSDAYQFSPELPDGLGSVRLFGIFSYQRAAAQHDLGEAFWKLEIRGPGVSEQLVRSSSGSVRIDARGTALAEFYWDGRDDAGRLAAAGKYRYTFQGRYLPDRMRPGKGVRHYDDLSGVRDAEEAQASIDEVVVNYKLDAKASRILRDRVYMSSCQIRQNDPIEPGFPYNFYYGSSHSHSNYSDGGQPTTGCSSGNVWGSGTFGPSEIYDYARNVAGLDYWVVNEHNHLIEDSIAFRDPPVTAAKVLQAYADGLAAAARATSDGSFVAVYGMEWGVTTNSNQGHVTLMETPRLFGWESCTGCNGPGPECVPGIDCFFEVFTPKRYGYLTLYQRSIENPSPAGPLGILCHPQAGEFDNYAFDANADAALQGIAVRSGLAFTSSTDCSGVNIGATDYTPRWRAALEKGFHVGPVADHDAHCNNYGVGIPNRTVYLLPNSRSPALTKQAWMEAHKARHFFASEDSNAQLVFATSDNSRIMGDIFTTGTSVTLRASVHDPEGEGVSTLEIWRGQAGGTTAPYVSVSGQSSLSITENICSGTYYYYVYAVQADGQKIWSAPMWITFNGAPDCLSLSGWRIEQQNSLRNLRLPEGTTISYGGYVIIARNAAKNAFENFWLGGNPLPNNVLYINAAGALPVINGGESFALYDSTGTLIDGQSIAMPGSGGRTVQRAAPCYPAGSSGSWSVASYALATPGSGAAGGCGGVAINEFADPSGTGDLIYEFIELRHYD
jgi:hypothetical protein